MWDVGEVKDVCVKCVVRVGKCFKLAAERC